ncbi:MAG: uracil-DNA glycosylase [Bacteroidota bacterium]|nr:uracil-DNA glycosylase [Bacteroidota bacterium]
MTKVSPKLPDDWLEILSDEFQLPYFSALKEFLLEERQQFTIHPPGGQILSALDHTPFKKVKVVILGQDPYPTPGHANGLCFSVNPGVAFPKSLINIFKEIKSDLGIPFPEDGNLSPWAEQGVFLLNAILTVRSGQPASHQNKGWERFTDRIIHELSEKREGLVFLLWGKYAQDKGAMIDRNKHHVLTAPHPSPLSAHRGFFGCRHFSKTNALLESMGKTPIHWDLRRT